MKFAVLFLGTDDFSLKCLNCLMAHKDFEVKGVITQPTRRKKRGMHPLPSPVKIQAQKMSLPLFTPHNLKDPDFLSQVQDLKAKWAILLSYGKILPPAFLSLFPNKALNFHASLLPRWRGAAPVQRAIMAGDKTLGISLQVMTQGLDKGPLIGAKSFELTQDMSALSAFDKMAGLMEELLTDMLSYMQGQKKPLPQDESQATYASKIDKKETRIIWKKPAVTLFNQIRALTKGPSAWTMYKGKRIKIYKAQGPMPLTEFNLNQAYGVVDSKPYKPAPTNTIQKAPPGGQVVEVQKHSFKVACGDMFFLSILTLQPESKNIMSAGEYIRGYNLKVGDKFD